MKNYKNLVPIGLVVFMGVGIYSVFANAATENSDYHAYLKKARKDAKLEVIEEAVQYYGKALELNDSIELRMEVGELYADQGWTSEAIQWGESIISKYPKESAGYEFLLKEYIEDEEYKDCFVLRDQAKARKAESKKFDELMSKIDYVYEYGFDAYDEVSVYSNGWCAVKTEDLWGYANEKGETKITAEFAWAGPFSADEVAPVKSEKGEFYYISDTGNKKIALQNIKKCTDIGLSSNGILVAADNEKYGYYDPNFKKIVGNYEYASAINGDIAAVKEGSKWKLIDAKGKVRGEDSYESVILDDKGIAFRNDRAFVEKADGYYLVDDKGKKIGKQKYEDARLFLEADGYAAVKVDGKWGFVDKTGKMVIEPQFADAHSFANGYAAIKKNGKWGFIDENGEIVIRAQFEDARDFNDKGNVFVKDGTQWRLLELLRNNYK